MATHKKYFLHGLKLDLHDFAATSFARRAIYFAFSIVLSLGLLDTLYGQQQGQPLAHPSGEAQDTVSLFSGRATVRLPLVNISGRGSASTGITLMNQGAGD